MKETRTKNIITRESVEKELYRLNRADIRATALLCAGASLFSLPLTAFMVYGLLSSTEAYFSAILLAVLAGVTMSAPSWITLILFFCKLSERELLLDGKFEIVTSPVVDKGERMAHRHTQKYLTFSGFRNKPVSNTVFEMSSWGDEFYLVYYQTKKTIIFLYPKKLYEYKQD